MNDDYSVVWETSALRKLGQLYNINHDKVYKSSKLILSRNPYSQSYGSADYPSFKFNGYHWSNIHNTIVIYRIAEQEATVFIDACYHANTGWALKVFYGENDSFE